MKKLLMLAAVACLALPVFAGPYAEVSVDDVKAAVANKKIVLLDANGTESWQKGHIPGAIDFAANKDNLASVLPKDKDALIVAYCGGPRCNAYQAAAKAAEKLGYKNVKHLKAGISGWEEAKGEMQKGT
jgi:rhodanese-related sulfurtransferase